MSKPHPDVPDARKRRRARDSQRVRPAPRAPLLGTAFVFSVFVNLLMLTGPLYMLQVYDRVLPAQAQETLLALTLLAGFLYTMMALLDFARGRLLARVGGRIMLALDARVFDGALQAGPERGGDGLRDLDALQRLFSSPALLALFDLPWTPLFLALIFVFHPWLGLLALGGGGLLILVAALNQRMTATAMQQTALAATGSEALSRHFLAEAETVTALGMGPSAFRHLQALRWRTLRAGLTAADRTGGFAALTRALRLFLQSAMLGLGAHLVLLESLSAGAMVAASILLGRALAPIEQSIANWPLIQRALQARRNLGQLLRRSRPVRGGTRLPRPAAHLQVDDLVVQAPGARKPALDGISFVIAPGQALGIIGASGSGKSSLAKALTGVWTPGSGIIRLGGASLSQYDAAARSHFIGYLPQQVRLFEGTVAQNIARLDPDAGDAAVLRAARRAGAHELILALPDGYDTRIGAADTRLSGGQIQRIGLARALFGDPVLLVLDEPNAHLDNAGSIALNQAVQVLKSEGCAVLVMAHRPAAIQHCDLLLMLDAGSVRALGPRDAVLKATVANLQALSAPAGLGGVA